MLKKCVLRARVALAIILNGVFIFRCYGVCTEQEYLLSPVKAIARNAGKS